MTLRPADPDLREIDAAVATHVFGHEDICFYNGDWYGAEEDWLVPSYTTDIAAAWRVLEHLIVMGIYFEITPPHGVDEYGRAGEWTVSGYDNYNAMRRSKVEGSAHTVPIAICLAALKALRPVDGKAGNP